MAKWKELNEKQLNKTTAAVTTTPLLTLVWVLRRRLWTQINITGSKVQQLKFSAEDSYPPKYHVDISVTRFIQEYSHLQPGDHLTNNISGRSHPRECLGKIHLL